MYLFKGCPLRGVPLYISELNFTRTLILLHTDSTHAVQHVLAALGYGSTGSKPGDKPGGPDMVAIEMEPEDVQWIKVQVSYSSITNLGVWQLAGI